VISKHQPALSLKKNKKRKEKKRKAKVNETQIPEKPSLRLLLVDWWWHTPTTPTRRQTIAHLTIPVKQ
jgi:hypothetical protein